MRVSAIVVGEATSQQMFGPDIEKANVLPVWIEVENRSPQPLWLLRSGTDPDYFSPLEVAWSMHKTLAGAANASIDDHVQELAFDNPIPPGATHSGVIFINPQGGTTLVNIDLFGRKTLVPFSLFLHPDDHDGPAPLTFQHPQAQITDYHDLDALRSALERLPCCATDASGSVQGDPLNVVLIGTMADIGAASIRRNYRRDVRESDHGAAGVRTGAGYRRAQTGADRRAGDLGAPVGNADAVRRQARLRRAGRAAGRRPLRVRRQGAASCCTAMSTRPGICWCRT